MIKRKKGLQRKAPLSRQRSMASATAGITSFSKARKAQIHQYSLLKHKLFDNGDEHPCEIKAPGGCQGIATDWHHPEGREGDRLLDVDKCKKCCRYCHRYCDEHPTWAIANGHSYSRL